MKKLIKSLLPAPLLSALRERRLAAERRTFLTNWDKATGLVRDGREAGPIRSVIVFPADPAAVVYSLGDDAMISATIAHFQKNCPDLRVSVLCHPGAAEQIIRSRGWEPIPMRPLGNFPLHIAEVFSSGRYDAFVAVGADVMDGYYNSDFSGQMIATADIAAKAGLRSSILGFSFNASPADVLTGYFVRLDKRVRVNVRDLSSLERLNAFSRINAHLVADSAFMLQPEFIDSETDAWIVGERAAGRQIIGLNLHPMLIRNAHTDQVRLIIDNMTDAVRATNATASISWMLIPHDYRDDAGIGDGICLRPMMQHLSADPSIRCRYFAGVHQASTLKALAGRMDGVVTGRMHLAIASLGMGVPVLCLTYQDKFEGLLRHFDLSPDLLLAPDVLIGRDVLKTKLMHFLSTLPELSHKVRTELPRVLALAEGNFTDD